MHLGGQLVGLDGPAEALERVVFQSAADVAEVRVVRHLEPQVDQRMCPGAHQAGGGAVDVGQVLELLLQGPGERPAVDARDAVSAPADERVAAASRDGAQLAAEQGEAGQDGEERTGGAGGPPPGLVVAEEAPRRGADQRSRPTRRAERAEAAQERVQAGGQEQEAEDARRSPARPDRRASRGCSLRGEADGQRGRLREVEIVQPLLGDRRDALLEAGLAELVRPDPDGSAPAADADAGMTDAVDLVHGCAQALAPAHAVPRPR